MIKIIFFVLFFGCCILFIFVTISSTLVLHFDFDLPPIQWVYVFASVWAAGIRLCKLHYGRHLRKHVQLLLVELYWRRPVPGKTKLNFKTASFSLLTLHKTLSLSLFLFKAKQQDVYSCIQRTTFGLHAQKCLFILFFLELPSSKSESSVRQLYAPPSICTLRCTLVLKK